MAEFVGGDGGDCDGVERKVQVERKAFGRVKTAHQIAFHKHFLFFCFFLV